MIIKCARHPGTSDKTSSIFWALEPSKMWHFNHKVVISDDGTIGGEFNSAMCKSYCHEESILKCKESLLFSFCHKKKNLKNLLCLDWMSLLVANEYNSPICLNYLFYYFSDSRPPWMDILWTKVQISIWLYDILISTTTPPIPLPPWHSINLNIALL